MAATQVPSVRSGKAVSTIKAEYPHTERPIRPVVQRMPTGSSSSSISSAKYEDQRQVAEYEAERRCARYEEDARVVGDGRRSAKACAESTFETQVYADPRSLQEFFSTALDNWLEDGDVDGALRKLGMRYLNDKFKGMEISFLAHQVLGVAFMMEKERDEKFRGGILADAMGLGKVIS